ncbi:MAG: type II secretion system F family protein [Candidatus Eremiobacteraeota bacterium]|nr:type II secretion system F family protein [Candidatus Eremiobacteraeota bacterium]
MQIVSRMGVLRPKRKSRVVFFRSLALLTASGIPFHQGLDVLAQQSEELTMRLVCSNLAQDLLTGQSLSLSMKNQSGCFNAFHVNLIKVGEKTGRLDRLLMKLADYEENNYRVALKVKSALTYPGFIFLLASVMLLLSPSLLFKGILPLLRAQGAELPLLSRLVLGLAELLAQGPVTICFLAGLACLVNLVWLAFQKPAARLRLYEKTLRQPLLGRMLRSLATARFASSLALQLDSGVTVLDALGMAAASTNNPVLERDIGVAHQSLSDGATFHRSLQLVGFFPDQFLSVIQAGQESGRIPPLLQRIASMYETEIDCSIDALISLLEPMVMLVMGLIVSVVAVALMLPMVNLVNAL